MSFNPQSDVKPSHRKLGYRKVNDTSEIQKLLFFRGDLHDHDQIVPHHKIFSRKFYEEGTSPLRMKFGKMYQIPPIETPMYRSTSSFDRTSFQSFMHKPQAAEAADIMSKQLSPISVFNPSTDAWKLHTHSRIAPKKAPPRDAFCVSGFRGIGNVYEASMLPQNDRPNQDQKFRVNSVPLKQLKFYGKRKYL